MAVYSLPALVVGGAQEKVSCSEYQMLFHWMKIKTQHICGNRGFQFDWNETFKSFRKIVKRFNDTNLIHKCWKNLSGGDHMSTLVLIKYLWGPIFLGDALKNFHFPWKSVSRWSFGAIHFNLKWAFKMEVTAKSFLRFKSSWLCHNLCYSSKQEM